jgi:hypothetical protein
MPRRSILALAAAIILAGCNKPAPEPAAAAPDTGMVDTVAAAGAPIADSATAMSDSVAAMTDSVATTDSVLTPLADSIADTTITN